MINGYALVFGVLIVTGGRLADLFGRKRIFMIGAGFFAVFSLAAGLMPNVVPLIVVPGAHGHRWRADVAGDPRNDLRASSPTRRRAWPVG